MQNSYFRNKLRKVVFFRTRCEIANRDEAEVGNTSCAEKSNFRNVLRTIFFATKLRTRTLRLKPKKKLTTRFFDKVLHVWYNSYIVLIDYGNLSYYLRCYIHVYLTTALLITIQNKKKLKFMVFWTSFVFKDQCGKVFFHTECGKVFFRTECGKESLFDTQKRIEKSYFSQLSCKKKFSALVQNSVFYFVIISKTCGKFLVAKNVVRYAYRNCYFSGFASDWQSYI